MAVTIQMIETKEFKTVAKGYDPEEVDVFLDDICDQFDEMENEIKSLRASLAKAQALLALHELADRADFCVADGLNALRGRPNVQCAVMCGMGGRLNGAALVLSSHTDIPLVRQTLLQIGYAITAERIVRAKGRFYVLMRAEPGNAHYTERELYLGPALLVNPPPLWQDYLRWREGVVACEAGHERQLAWIREELAK